MSILIKGTEMPVSCAECFAELYSWCGITQKPISDITLRPQDCPLIEIPPHGRLIDADVLSQIYRFDDYGKAVVDCEDMDNAPTIIEAEVDDG